MFDLLYKVGKRAVESKIHSIIEENTADYIVDAVKEVSDDIRYISNKSDNRNRRSRFEGKGRFESNRFR